MDEIELLDIADDLLVINRTTIERLFQEDNQNTLILYLFYYKTAKWQKINPIKASDEYCKKCLHWGIDKLQTTKARLKEMNLIETIRKTNSSGLVIGWYVKVNYLVDYSTIPETTIPTLPVVVKQETNTIYNNNKILNNNKDTYKRKKFEKPTLEEVKEYCLERKNNVDAELFINYYESNGWKVGKNSMKNWKAAVRTWERNKVNKPKESRYEREKRLLEEMLVDEED